MPKKLKQVHIKTLSRKPTQEERLGLIQAALKSKKIGKAMMKQKEVEQTQVGMACSTKTEPYFPPTRPNRKPKL